MNYIEEAKYWHSEAIKLSKYENYAIGEPGREARERAEDMMINFICCAIALGQLPAQE